MRSLNASAYEGVGGDREVAGLDDVKLGAGVRARPASFDDIDAALDMDDETRAQWWNTPRAWFAGRTPLELHFQGFTDALLADLRGVHIGAY